MERQETFECYAYSEDKKRWFFIGWYPKQHIIVRENAKYWFSADGYRYKKPTA